MRDAQVIWNIVVVVALIFIHYRISILEKRLDKRDEDSVK